MIHTFQVALEALHQIRVWSVVKPKLANRYDLVAVLGLSFVYLAIVLVGPGSAFHGLLGLPFALILPGYAIQAAVYPHVELDLPMRLALGCVLSLTVVTILAMILNALGRLDLTWLAGSLELIIIVCCAVAHGRRSRSEQDDDSLLPRFVRPSRRQLMLVIGGSVLVFAGFAAVTGMLANLLTRSQPQTYTTAFFLLGEKGRAGDYPAEVTLGQPFPATLGIINREQGAEIYRIEMQIDRQTPEALAEVSLQPGETWEQTFAVTVGRADSATARVDFYLYREADRAPYRAVHVRVRISEVAAGTPLPPPAAELVQLPTQATPGPAVAAPTLSPQPSPAPALTITPTRTPSATPFAPLTPSPTPEPPREVAPTSVPSPSSLIGPWSVVHVAQAGETLTQIAERYGSSLADIVQANGLEDPNLVWAGQVVTVPLRSAAAALRATSVLTGAEETSTGAIDLPAVILLSPLHGGAQSGPVKLEWRWIQPLAAGQYYAILLWRADQPSPSRLVFATRVTHQLDLEAYPADIYRWAIRVVEGDQREQFVYLGRFLTPASERWSFVWAGGEG